MSSAFVTQESDRSHTARAARPRLSVVILSKGAEQDLERAVLSVSDVVYALEAQLVVVREDSQDGGRERCLRLAQQHHCSFVFADPGSSRAMMSDEGMRLATGDIVTLRDDNAVRDGDWLGVFARHVGLKAERRPTADASVSTIVADERAAAVAGAHRPVTPRYAHSTRRLADASTEAVS